MLACRVIFNEPLSFHLSFFSFTQRACRYFVFSDIYWFAADKNLCGESHTLFSARIIFIISSLETFHKITSSLSLTVLSLFLFPSLFLSLSFSLFLSLTTCFTYSLLVMILCLSFLSSIQFPRKRKSPFSFFLSLYLPRTKTALSVSAKALVHSVLSHLCKKTNIHFRW